MKSSDAYKTIEKFQKNTNSQICIKILEEIFQLKLLKRKGGRRLYSVNDINLLRRIKELYMKKGIQ